MSEVLKFWLPIIVSVLIAVVTIIISIIQNRKNNKIVEGLNKKNNELSSKLKNQDNFVELNKEFLDKYRKLEKEYLTYQDKIEKLEEKVEILEDIKVKYLLSKIFKIDITFPSIEDKLLLSSLNDEIEPETDIDSLLKGLIALHKFKEENDYDLKEEYAAKSKKFLLQAIEKRKEKNKKNIVDDKKDVIISECYNYLGVLYDKKEEYEKAIQNYEQSIEKNKENSKPYYNLACSYARIYEGGKLFNNGTLVINEINTNLKKALELKPEDYSLAIEDYDLNIIKTEPFFLKLINETAKEQNKCNLFSNNITSLTSDLLIELVESDYIFPNTSNNQLRKLTIWCLDKIFKDQFKNGDEKGAWSLRNNEYVKFLYGNKGIPKNKYVVETITMSSLIVRNISRFLKLNMPKELRIEIENRLFNYFDYINKHFDNGFGLRTFKSNGNIIHVTFNHNLRAILSIIWNKKNLSNSLSNKLNIACNKLFYDIENNLVKLENIKSEALSALHLLISEYKTTLLELNIKKMDYIINKIETQLTRNYEKNYNSWDMTDEMIERERIDKALFVLSDIKISTIKTKKLKDIFIYTINEFIQATLIKDEQTGYGLPFIDGEEKDLGATLQFLLILNNNKKEIKIEPDIIKNIYKFLEIAILNSKFTKFSYPWFLSSILTIIENNKL